MLSVITGKAKGIQLNCPHKAKPMSSRARAALFAVIGPDIVDKKILDLYAGSGVLGIEALSRGASHSTFVDSDRYAVGDIKENLQRTGFTDQAYVTERKAMQFLDDQPNEEFDIVFVDPPFPFYKEQTHRMRTLLEHTARVTAEGGAIILKHPHKIEVPEIANLILADQRKFGTNAVTIWVKKQKKES